MSRANTRQTHPLIPREQTYVLDRKIVSIHSMDRDIKKWPHANHFEINLPETLCNVQSMRLVTISLPSNQYVFSNEYQNTKLSFYTVITPSGESPCTGEYTIELREGSYTPHQLAITIANLMNYAVQAGTGCAKGEFVCAYNSVSNTFWFGNNKYPFTLLFGKKEVYTHLCPGQPDVFNHYTRWGLPAYLGYKKQNYKAIPVKDVCPNCSPGAKEVAIQRLLQFDYEGPADLGGGGAWLGGATGSVDRKAYVVNLYDPSIEVCNLDIYGEDAIYMEIDRYNTLDEIEPYSENTSGWFNNDYNGKVNSAFAKIPVTCTPYTQVFDSRNGFL
ncbi:MAG: hypothetical protein V3W20_13210, partial [Candidatus Neomarinimicrobiota bacterium]